MLIVRCPTERFGNTEVLTHSPRVPRAGRPSCAGRGPPAPVSGWTAPGLASSRTPTSPSASAAGRSGPPGVRGANQRTARDQLQVAPVLLPSGERARARLGTGCDYIRGAGSS